MGEQSSEILGKDGKMSVCLVTADKQSITLYGKYWIRDDKSYIILL